MYISKRCKPQNVTVQATSLNRPEAYPPNYDYSPESDFYGGFNSKSMRFVYSVVPNVFINQSPCLTTLGHINYSARQLIVEKAILNHGTH